MNNQTQPIGGNQTYSMVIENAKQIPVLDIGNAKISKSTIESLDVDGSLTVTGAVNAQSTLSVDGISTLTGEINAGVVTAVGPVLVTGPAANNVTNLSVTGSVKAGALTTQGLSTLSTYEAITLPAGINLAISASQIVQGISCTCSRDGGTAYNISLASAAELAAKVREVTGLAVVAGQRLPPIVIHSLVGIGTLNQGGGIALFPNPLAIAATKTGTCTLSFLSETQLVGLCSLSA